MKKCPACDKTFADGMKFCQTDGTLLIEDVPAADPFKTVVADQNEIAAAIPPLDPFKTMVASPSKTADDILQLPEELDALKTMIVSQDELRQELKAGDDMLSLDAPPPFAASAPLIEPKPASPKPDAPAPKFDEFPPSPATFGDASSGSKDFPETGASDATAIMDSSISRENTPSPFDSKPFTNDFSTQSPYGNQENKPIPSPFDLSMAPGYQPPADSPFDAPKPLKDAESPFGGFQEQANQSPFSPPSPFGNAEPFNQSPSAAEWTPPPAPVSEWQNQQLGANTPFQPPGATGGQDQTLAIVSLVCGILGLVCCGLITGIPAIITGYMAKNNADSNPNQYGGRGLAVAGMIMGGISILFSILGIIYYIILIATAASR